MDGEPGRRKEQTLLFLFCVVVLCVCVRVSLTPFLCVPSFPPLFVFCFLGFLCPDCSLSLIFDVQLFGAQCGDYVSGAGFWYSPPS